MKSNKERAFHSQKLCINKSIFAPSNPINLLLFTSSILIPSASQVSSSTLSQHPAFLSQRTLCQIFSNRNHSFSKTLFVIPTCRSRPSSSPSSPASPWLCPPTRPSTAAAAAPPLPPPAVTAAAVVESTTPARAAEPTTTPSAVPLTSSVLPTWTAPLVSLPFSYSTFFQSFPATVDKRRKTASTFFANL